MCDKDCLLIVGVSVMAVLGLCLFVAIYAALCSRREGASKFPEAPKLPEQTDQSVAMRRMMSQNNLILDDYISPDDLYYESNLQAVSLHGSYNNAAYTDFMDNPDITSPSRHLSLEEHAMQKKQNKTRHYSEGAFSNFQGSLERDKRSKDEKRKRKQENSDDITSDSSSEDDKNTGSRKKRRASTEEESSSLVSSSSEMSSSEEEIKKGKRKKEKRKKIEAKKKKVEESEDSEDARRKKRRRRKKYVISDSDDDVRRKSKKRKKKIEESEEEKKKRRKSRRQKKVESSYSESESEVQTKKSRKKKSSHVISSRKEPSRRQQNMDLMEQPPVPPRKSKPNREKLQKKSTQQNEVYFSNGEDFPAPPSELILPEFHLTNGEAVKMAPIYDNQPISAQVTKEESEPIIYENTDHVILKLESDGELNDVIIDIHDVTPVEIVKDMSRVEMYVEDSSSSDTQSNEENRQNQSDENSEEIVEKSSDTVVDEKIHSVERFNDGNSEENEFVENKFVENEASYTVGECSDVLDISQDSIGNYVSTSSSETEYCVINENIGDVTNYVNENIDDLPNDVSAYDETFYVVKELDNFEQPEVAIQSESIEPTEEIHEFNESLEKETGEISDVFDDSLEMSFIKEIEKSRASLRKTAPRSRKRADNYDFMFNMLNRRKHVVGSDSSVEVSENEEVSANTWDDANEIVSSKENFESVSSSKDVGSVSSSKDVEDVESVSSSKDVEDVESVSSSKDVEDVESVSSSKDVEDVESVSSSKDVEDVESVSSSKDVEDVESVSSSKYVEDVESVSSSKDVEDVESVSSSKDVEDVESVSSSRDVEDVESVSSSKDVEDVESVSSSKDVEDVESVSSSKDIEVVESVSSSKDVEDVESVSSSKDVEDVESVSSKHDENTEIISNNENESRTSSSEKDAILKGDLSCTNELDGQIQDCEIENDSPDESFEEFDEEDFMEFVKTQYDVEYDVEYASEEVVMDKNDGRRTANVTEKQREKDECRVSMGDLFAKDVNVKNEDDSEENDSDKSHEEESDYQMNNFYRAKPLMSLVTESRLLEFRHKNDVLNVEGLFEALEELPLTQKELETEFSGESSSDENAFSADSFDQFNINIKRSDDDICSIKNTTQVNDKNSLPTSHDKTLIEINFENSNDNNSHLDKCDIENLIHNQSESENSSDNQSDNENSDHNQSESEKLNNSDSNNENTIDSHSDQSDSKNSIDNQSTDNNPSDSDSDDNSSEQLDEHCVNSNTCDVTTASCENNAENDSDENYEQLIDVNIENEGNIDVPGLQNDASLLQNVVEMFDINIFDGKNATNSPSDVIHVYSTDAESEV